jgi:hypothetical protein
VNAAFRMKRSSAFQSIPSTLARNDSSWFLSFKRTLARGVGDVG